MGIAKKNPAIWLDLMGGTIVIAAIGALLYLSFGREHSAAHEVATLRSKLNETRRSLGDLKVLVENEEKALDEKRIELEKSGHLPVQPPIEEDLEKLSMLAANHGLSVVRVEPLPSRDYEGLLEMRYSFEVSGKMPNMTRFFRSIEEADSWADIGFFRIESSRSMNGDDPQELTAMLTISLFSSAT